MCKFRWCWRQVYRILLLMKRWSLAPLQFLWPPFYSIRILLLYWGWLYVLLAGIPVGNFFMLLRHVIGLRLFGLVPLALFFTISVVRPVTRLCGMHPPQLLITYCIYRLYESWYNNWLKNIIFLGNAVVYCQLEVVFKLSPVSYTHLTLPTIYSV